MTTLAAPTGNEIQNVLAASYTRGTDTTVTLTDGGAFPNSAHVIRITDGAKWCLIIYTTKATHVLTMGGGAADYALAKNVTVGDEAHEFAIGSTVELVCVADEIAQLFTGEAAAIHDNVAAEIVAVTEKTAPIGADEFLIEDSAASNAKKSLKFSNTPLSILKEAVTTKTAIATLTIAEAGTVLVSCAATPYTITLPTASGNDGLRYHFIKTDANYFLITLDGNGAETFNYENATGAPVTTYPRLNTYCAEVTVVSDGTNWQCINEQLGLAPKCKVYLSSDQLNLVNSTFTLIEFDSEMYDIGSNFNTTTHKFVAPIPGEYRITEFLGWLSATIAANARYGLLYKIGANIQYYNWAQSSMTQSLSHMLIDDMALSAADEVTMEAASFSGDNLADVEAAATYMIIQLMSKD